MIRIVLLGRTGNHLFQYAFGRVLATSPSAIGVGRILGSMAQVGSRSPRFLGLPIRAQVVRSSFGARALRKLTGKHYWEFRGALAAGRFG